MAKKKPPVRGFGCLTNSPELGLIQDGSVGQASGQGLVTGGNQLARSLAMLVLGYTHAIASNTSVGIDREASVTDFRNSGARVTDAKTLADLAGGKGLAIEDQSFKQLTLLGF